MNRKKYLRSGAGLFEKWPVSSMSKKENKKSKQIRTTSVHKQKEKTDSENCRSEEKNLTITINTEFFFAGIYRKIYLKRFL